MGIILLIISAALLPFILILALHFYAKYKLTNKLLIEERSKILDVINRLQEMEARNKKIRSDLNALKSPSYPKWTTDPKKMTHDQLEHCVNYFIENYNKVKN